MDAKNPLTYAAAGVSVDAGNELVRRIKSHVARTRRPGVLGGIGGFGSLFQLDLSRFPDPVLVSGTDGVGTKLRLAFLTGVHNTVGQDLVAMNANDILCNGAEPLYFLDYIGCSNLDPAVLEQVVAGIADGCALAGAALVGGETAEMPGFYEPGEYDLAGFVVGAVAKSRLLTGEEIKPGHALVALAASGLHSNGYSLARRVLLKNDGGAYALDQHVPEFGRTLAEEMLEPTRIYPKVFLALRENFPIHGATAITGGGLVENIPRMLPARTRAVIRWGAWQVPAVFELIRRLGPVEPAEMVRTFNVGLGMVLAVPSEHADAVVRQATALGCPAYIVGEVTELPADVSGSSAKGADAEADCVVDGLEGWR